jgi:hypothetical protein
VHHSAKIMFDKTFTVNVNEKERSSVSNCPHCDTFTRMDVVVKFRQNSWYLDQVKNIRESRFENVGYLIDLRK